MEGKAILTLEDGKQERVPSSFYLLVIGDVISRIGDYIYQLAIPLYIYFITGSPIWMGVAFAVEQSALILSGIFMGPLVDRGNPLKIVKANALIQTILVSLLPVAHILGFINIYFIFVIGFLLITSNFLYRTAINSLIPIIVEKQNLPTAAGHFSLGRSLSKTVGPLLAAFLISAFSPISSLWIDGASFLFVFGIMLLINLPKNALSAEVSKEVKNNNEKESFLSSVKEGLLIVFKSPEVFPLVVFNFFLNFGFVGMFSMMTFHLKDTLNLTTQEIGYVFMMDGIGAFLAAMCLSKLMKKIRNGYLILGSAVIMGVAIISIGNIQNVFLVGFLFGIVMFTSQINNRTLYTVWQMNIPKNQLGRVFSFSTMIEGISVPIAGIVAGFIISQFNSNTLMIFCGIIVGCVAIIFTFLSKIRLIDNRI